MPKDVVPGKGRGGVLGLDGSLLIPGDEPAQPHARQVVGDGASDLVPHLAAPRLADDQVGAAQPDANRLSGGPGARLRRRARPLAVFRGQNGDDGARLGLTFGVGVAAGAGPGAGGPVSCRMASSWVVGPWWSRTPGLLVA